MIGLAEIKAINNRPTIIRDNFNRDSSAVESSAGYVIHSGIHRSTAFISKADHPECWFAFTYWKLQGQAAVNAFIVALIDDTGNLEGAERNAFHATRPDWRVRIVKGSGKLAGRELVASIASGRLTRSASACTWRHLHHRTA